MKIADTQKFIRELGPERAIKACNYQLPVKEIANKRCVIIPVELIVINPHRKLIYLKERCHFSSRLELGDCKCVYHRVEKIFRASLERVSGDLESVYGSGFVRDLEYIMS